MQEFDDDQSPMSIKAHSSEQLFHFDLDAIQLTVLPYEQSNAIPSLFNSLEQLGKQYQFDTISQTHNNLLLMCRQDISVRQRIQKYCCGDLRDSKYCLIRIRYTNGNIQLKGLQGVTIYPIKSSSLAQELIATLINHIQNFQPTEISQNQDEEEQNPYYLESLATTIVYQYCNSTTITKLNSLKEVYAQMEKLHTQIKSLPDNTKYELLLPYYKHSIERYLISDIYETLFQSYITKWQHKDTLFDQKRATILQKSFQEIMTHLEVKLPFQKDYNQSIYEFTRINQYKSPSDKLKCLQMAINQLRAEAFSAHQELVAMDDELPVVIYVTLSSRSTKLYANLNYIDDYIRNDEERENENKIITNIRVSLDYILNEWN